MVMTLLILNSVPVGQAFQDLSRSGLKAGMTFVLTSHSCLYPGFILEGLSGTILVLCIIVIATPVQIRKMATAVAILQALAATAESKLTFDFF